MRSSEDRRLKLYRGTWCVTWREDGETKRTSLRTSDRATAERNFEEFLRQEGSAPETINQILDAWEIEKAELKSMKYAKFKMRPLRAFFGNLKTEHITKPKCRAYRDARKVSHTTVRNELAILRSAINWFNPDNKAQFEFPPTAQPKDHFLSRDEYLRLLDGAESPHIELFIMLALHTAARATAILELTWDRVDLNRRLINLAKGDHGNKRRALVPINDSLYPELLKAHEARTSDFVIEYAGGPVLRVSNGFRKTALRAGVSASPHMLRHTAAMVMAEADIPMQEISQFLGHAGVGTTMRVYAKYSPSFLRNAANALHVWHQGSNEPTAQG